MVENIKSRIMSQNLVIYASSSHILDVFEKFVYFVQAKGSLRDLRYFFSTNNLRLVKIFLEISHKTLTPKIFKSKNTHLSNIWTTLCQFSVDIERFWEFDVCVQAWAALRVLRFFFSTNNLRLVKSFLQISNESPIVKLWKTQNRGLCLNFEWFVQIIAICWTFLRNLYFCPSKGFSVGSQIFFLDKKSGTS